MRSNGAPVEALREQTEAANEEHVLAELAQIEALKEAGEIEAQKVKEAGEFSLSMEVDQSKELETKLGAILFDFRHLQDKQKQVKGLDNVVPRGDDDCSEQQDDSFHNVERFSVMSSMDIIRNELKHVKEETEKLKKTEEKAYLKVKSLNSKLVRAKSNLEATSAAKDKAKSIETNLSLTLEQSKAEPEASKKEKVLITKDIETIKAEIQKTESEIDVT
ncbi:protein PLASTID MOVEMENT IMPAIRED 2-like [Hibiscus syriacus]|uniref:protein PLASTID MOVEMENT IMPAIRED 2-like n=1 Tax=Hibiscus syriacus TaxID=106335 RepID=UPI0019213B62|nr:protein PLASTID MOVEMENT IMPAIRED 2-like [Hibiscus syriacus]